MVKNQRSHNVDVAEEGIRGKKIQLKSTIETINMKSPLREKSHMVVEGVIVEIPAATTMLEAMVVVKIAVSVSQR